MKNQVKYKKILAFIFVLGFLLGIGFSYLNQYIQEIAG